MTLPGALAKLASVRIPRVREVRTQKELGNEGERVGWEKGEADQNVLAAGGLGKVGFKFKVSPQRLLLGLVVEPWLGEAREEVRIVASGAAFSPWLTACGPVGVPSMKESPCCSCEAPGSPSCPPQPFPPTCSPSQCFGPCTKQLVSAAHYSSPR